MDDAMMSGNAVEGEGLKARLESRLRRLTYDDVVDWVGDVMAERAWNYRENVREVYGAPDGYMAWVQGTRLYAAKLTLDDHGEFVSKCSCPVGENCKHAGALALVASEWLKSGLPIGAKVPEELTRDLAKAEKPRREALRPPVRPPLRDVCITVTENPFGRFTSNGGHHASDFSFRVVSGEKTYHWSFIISTLIYSLAKHGLSFDYGGDRWYDLPSKNDPPLFTCSCGVLECDGFKSQFCTYSDSAVEWVVEHCGEKIRFSFDRVSYEVWAVQAIWRMRGGWKLRKDPWEYVVRLPDFERAVSALRDVSARCRVIWRLLEEKRRLSNDDLESVAGVLDEDLSVDVREYFGKYFSTEDLIDLRQTKPLSAEAKRIEERMTSACPEHLGYFVYVPVYAPNWQPTEIKTDDRLEFYREIEAKSGSPVIRVVSENRGKRIGRLRKEDARWISGMMDRHGMILKGHPEPVRRYGKGLMVRVDLSFASRSAGRFDWGASLEPEHRLYFEMIRSVALRLKEYPAALIQTEVERLRSVFCTAMSCPETAFLFAIVTAAVMEIKARMTDEEVSRRMAKCVRVRHAMECQPVGSILDYEGLEVLPLVATGTVPADGMKDVPEGARNFIRLTWGSDPNPRVKVDLPDFPADATGFAVFRNGSLIDLCLTGVPIASAGLFDNLAIYAKETDCRAILDEATAFSLVQRFLDELPIREPNEESGEMRYWLELGIHDGSVELDDQDNLISLRIVMRSARKEWCD